MGAIILGRDRNSRGKRVWLPPGTMRELQADVVKTCMLVVNMNGDVCGQKFVRGQEQLAEQHAIKCAREHGDVIEAYMKMRRPDGMKAWDPEYENWLQRNKVGIREGRVRW